MKRIEFTGIAGIGKTTLYKAVCNQRSIDDTWITPSEAQLKIVKEKIKGGFIINRIALIKFGLLKRFHPQWIREMIRRYKWDVYNKTLNQSHNFWLNLMIEYYSNNLEAPPESKLELMGRFMHEVELIAYLEHFNIQETVVWDEGLFKILPGISNIERFKTLIDENIKKSSLTDPAGIIYCVLDVKENYRRRKQRLKEGKGSQVEKALNDEQLYQKCKDMNDRHGKLMKESNIKLPLLEIDLANNFEDNVQKCLKFIRDIDKQQ